MKKIILIILSLATFASLILIAGSLLLLFLAPSPKNLKEQIVPSTSTESMSSKKQKQFDEDEIHNSSPKAYKKHFLDKKQSAGPFNTTSAKNLAEQRAEELANLKFNYLMSLENDLNELANDQEFCEKIASSTTSIRNKEEAHQEWLWQRQNPGQSLHPTLQAHIGPLKALSQKKYIRKVLKKIHTAKSNSNLIDKAQFYYNIAQAVNEMNQSEKEIQQKSNSYYLMGLLSKAALEQPAIIQSEEFSTLCLNLQEQLTDKGIENNSNKSQIQLSTEYLERLTKDYDIDLKSLGYDKKYINSTQTHAKVNLENGEFSMQIKIPWEKSFFSEAL